jgi:hypothetical protein
MPEDVRISSEPMAPESDAEYVRNGLALYNVGRTGHDSWRPVKLFVRDGTGLIRGGLLGDIWGGWLHVTILWLEEFSARRRTGTQPDGHGGGGSPRRRVPLRSPGQSQLSGANVL